MLVRVCQCACKCVCASESVHLCVCANFTQSSTNPAHHPTPFSRLPLYKSKRRREAFAASGPLEPASEVTRANLSTKAKRNHPRGNSDTEKEESGRTEIEESPRMDLGRTPSS